MNNIENKKFELDAEALEAVAGGSGDFCIGARVRFIKSTVCPMCGKDWDSAKFLVAKHYPKGTVKDIVWGRGVADVQMDCCQQILYTRIDSFSVIEC